jgi:hypothetical protein
MKKRIILNTKFALKYKIEVNNKNGDAFLNSCQLNFSQKYVDCGAHLLRIA